MDTAALVIGNCVLAQGSIRETARRLGRPVSSVSAAFSRLQSHIVRPIASPAGNRMMPTLEGSRLRSDLEKAAALAVGIAMLDGISDASEQRAARTAIPLLALFRFGRVAGAGSIRRAALGIGIGQPQLTRQIRSLEASVGVELLARGTAGVIPTEAGLKLLGLVAELEEVWARISGEASDRFRLARATTKLGSIPPLGLESPVAKLLASLAAHWEGAMPKSPLFISTNNTEDLLRGLGNRDYDLVLLDSVSAPANAEHLTVSHAKLVIVARRETITSFAGDLRALLCGRRLAMLSLKSALRQRFLDLVERTLTPEEGRRLSYVEVESVPVIANLVIEHDFVAMLPQWALSGLGGEVSTVTLPAPFAMRLSLLWNRDGRADAALAAGAILEAHGFIASGEA